MLKLQEFMLEKNPTRRELLEYNSQSTELVRVGIYRNHSFELIEHTIPAYLDFAGLRAEFVYSDYDDSLSFINIDKNVDMLILWLDMTRYKTSNLNEFLEERIGFLCQMFTKPVLLIPFEGVVEIKNKSVITLNLDHIKEELGNGYLDLRMESYTGTKLSARAGVRISKELGLKYIPAAIKPALKAIILDLDNTLYKGVLGEDGINGVMLTEGHKVLQQKLKELSSQGFFLCIASKNDIRDVIDMFRQRKDFPLKESDFVAIRASWDEKSIAVRELLKTLNINADSLIFIDDNIGELTAMRFAYPTIKILHAKGDGRKTAEMLAFYPGLLKLSVQPEDAIRKEDTRANLEREELRSKLSKEDYIKSLEIKLMFDINNPKNMQRIQELANKTNQFIFNYMRYSYGELEKVLNSGNGAIISVSLSDKLSDSGIIGACVAIKEKDYVRIEEMFVSCRALGRGIDDVIVLGCITEAAKYLGLKKVKVQFKRGERNEPAEIFVGDFLSEYIEEEKELKYEFPKDMLEIIIRKG